LREEAGLPAHFEPNDARAFDPAAFVVGCIESGARALLLDVRALPPEFFDLSTGMAGELVQKLTNYGLRMAAVVPDPTLHSPRFQDFAREANRGRQLRFVPTREEAIRWLESGGATSARSARS
jgi:hypothetical protein